ncbi:MAG: methylenetetrahydrofolate reductase [Anaerolineales bacterium]|nr:MAG: methylenetetrahydrofolate reductase [Anaerolineales bacterium]
MTQASTELAAGSNLEKVFRAGHFAVTGELGPPASSNRKVVEDKAQHFKTTVDAINVTDNQTAVVRMSSISVGTILLGMGLEPVIQMTARDRNRIAIQADLLGASALGVKNLLCLTGDHQMFGNHPVAKGVFDMDSLQMLSMVRDMRDKGVVQSGDEMDVPPRFFLGAAANPFAPPYDFRIHRLAKKVKAGAQFIQTQIVYNVDRFAEYMKRAGDAGLLDNLYVMAGVTPVKSVGAARYMASQVPGLEVPDEIVQRMVDSGAGIPKEDKAARRAARREEGINICVEIIQRVREIAGVAGVHIMAIEWEEAVPTIVERAGLLPRPKV